MRPLHLSILGILYLAMIPLAGAAQSILGTPDAYLGQDPPGNVPKKFAPDILVDKGMMILGRIAITHDGRDIIYDQAPAMYGTKDSVVKSVEFDGHVWCAPHVLKFSHFVQDPTLALDEKHLLFMNEYGDSVRSERTEQGWSEPQPFLKGKNFMLYNLMPVLSGDYYLGTNGSWGKPGDWNSARFSKASVSGTDIFVQDLGTPLNDPGFNGDFYVAPDESYMVVSANETPDFECELFISFRHSDGTWSKPVSLGRRINDGPAHRWGAFVSPEGKYLFYTRGTEKGGCAIYWVRFDTLLRDLRTSG
jgi:hypothetical protein